jgi:hypothetical protein
VRQLIAAGLIAVIALVATASAQAAPPVRVPTYEGATLAKGLARHPRTIVWTGGGTGILERLHWTGWGDSSTHATGVNALKTCEPDCADGTTTRYPVRVKAFARKRVHGTLVYSRIQYRFIGAPPFLEGFQFPQGAQLDVRYGFGGFNLVGARPRDSAAVTSCGDYVFINQHRGYWTAHSHVAGYSPVFGLTTRNVGCGVARPFALNVSREFRHPRHHAGFVCTTHVFNGEDYDIRCVEGNKLIHWTGGA